MATQLENNTSSLQAVLSTVNALPNQSEQVTPTIAINSSGLITATAGTKSATKQLTTQAAKTVTPSTSSQTAVSSGVYTTGNITVAAIPSSYVQPTSIKFATTYTPTTSNQTISAGTYCSGAQTIKGDSNLIASNIKSGVSIFGVTGSYTESDGGSSGDGGNVEMCSVNINFNAPVPRGATVYHYNNNLEVIASSIDAGIAGIFTFSTIKGSLIYITSWSGYVGSGDATEISNGSQSGNFIINSDCILIF